MSQPVRSVAPGASDVNTRFHWPALDGLRGVAVIAVILFHASSSITPNGFAGVDVFFGLSGFLITALLLREHHVRGRISLPQFYMRRILRLYPALFVVCLVVLALALVTGNLSTGGPVVLAALFYVAHLWIYSGHDGWLLEHTWTLSLEEHYYLLWPTVVIAGLAGRRWRWLAVSIGVSVTLLIAIPGVLPAGTQAAYERGTPMIYGSLAAIVWWRFRGATMPRRLGWIANLALLIMVAMVLVPWDIAESWLTGATSVPGILAIVVVVSSVALPESLGARCLDWNPLIWTGRRAYGLYLYHFPILSVMAHHIDLGFPTWLSTAMGVVLSFAVAAISYRWLELPFLRLKSRFGSTA